MKQKTLENLGAAAFVAVVAWIIYKNWNRKGAVAIEDAGASAATDPYAGVPVGNPSPPIRYVGPPD